jgi:hypothetical protein
MDYSSHKGIAEARTVGRTESKLLDRAAPPRCLQGLAWFLVSLGDIITITIDTSSSKAAAQDNRVRESPTSFSFSQGVSQVINAFVRKQPGSKAEQRFEKSTRSFLLDVPPELLNRVMDFFLITNAHPEGTYSLTRREEAIRFCGVQGRTRWSSNGGKVLARRPREVAAACQ